MFSVRLPLSKIFLRQRLSRVRKILSGRLPFPTREELLKSLKRGEMLILADSHATKQKRTEKGFLSVNIPKDTLIYTKSPLDAQKTENIVLSQPAFKEITDVKVRKRTTLSGVITTSLFIFFLTTSILLLSVLLAPSVYYTLFPSDPVPITSTNKGTPLGGDFAQSPQHASTSAQLPPYDESLPEGDWLIIPRIGVRTEILESEKPEDSLNKGVWRVPDFGKPTDPTKPVILAAHRYGWKNWWDKTEYWKYHSFYLLPELQPGDLVEVIWQKRRYVYEIYGGEEGTLIKDYNADLILYTCKFLESPLRHFRYARLVNFNSANQAIPSAKVE
jgi:hypothetical protein